jgi:hypothetical protein
MTTEDCTSYLERFLPVLEGGSTTLFACYVSDQNYMTTIFDRENAHQFVQVVGTVAKQAMEMKPRSSGAPYILILTETGHDPKHQGPDPTAYVISGLILKFNFGHGHLHPIKKKQLEFIYECAIGLSKPDRKVRRYDSFAKVFPDVFEEALA